MVASILQKNQVLDTIAARASTPLERLQAGFEVDGGSSLRSDGRLERLETLVASIQGATLTDFLARHSINHEALSSALTSAHMRQDAQRPHWVETLHEIITVFPLDFTHESQFSDLDRCQDAHHPLPFEEFVLPFIRFARQKVKSNAHAQSSLLTENAHIMLEKRLLFSLTRQVGQALQSEFSLFRAARQYHSSNKASQTVYHAFLAQYNGSGMLSFFLEYSVLARILVSLIENWIASISEFLWRFETDRQELEQLFHDSKPLGSIVAILSGMSDPHHHGRSVFLLTFASDLNLIYKPRSLKLDDAFFHLLSWINTNTYPGPSLQGIRVLSRATYGWAECVKHAPCQNEGDVQRYYQRAGALACLCYLFQGSDMHHENVIASRDCPMIVDLEMLMAPDPTSLFKSLDPLSPQSPTKISTALNSGLLPYWMKVNNDQVVDISGLGYTDEQVVMKEYPHWISINTDTMELAQQPVSLAAGIERPNMVFLKETPVKAIDYVEDIVVGFRTMYRFLLEQRDVLRATDGPLSLFSGCSTRFVYRATRFYANHVNRLLHPKLLRDAADRWIEMACFTLVLPRVEHAERLWPLFEAEIRSLEQLDVPWFGVKTDEHDLIDHDGAVIIKNAFPRSILASVRSTIERLNEIDLEVQLSLIRTACLTSLPFLPDALEEEVDAFEDFQGDVFPPSDLAAHAYTIGKDLKHRALSHSHWLSLRYHMPTEQYLLQFAPTNLYEGTGGIAFFIAALAHVTGEREWQELARTAGEVLYERVLREVNDSSESTLAQMDIGGASGIASYIYTLCYIGTWLHIPAFLDDARQFASLITPERIAADRFLDVISGSAGAILGLLTLYRMTGDEEVLQRAVLCGEVLLKTRVGTPGTRTWLRLDEHPLTGFSHGAAGIAYALLRLFEVTHQQELREAAIEAINYEQQLFLPDVGNWPDLRGPAVLSSSQTCRTSWCHGAPGIGLARLGALSYLDTPQIRQDIEVALDTTLNYGLPSLDNLCCGNFGRLELLIAASQHLHRPELLEIARMRATFLIHRASESGGFHLINRLPRSVYNPTLFQGMAGIGYELLRMADPASLPSVLLWE